MNIVMTVLALAGAAAVALVCDMLKANNERLRQVNLELQIRGEEQRRRAELALERLASITAASEPRLTEGPKRGTIEGANLGTRGLLPEGAGQRSPDQLREGPASGTPVQLMLNSRPRGELIQFTARPNHAPDAALILRSRDPFYGTIAGIGIHPLEESSFDIEAIRAVVSDYLQAILNETERVFHLAPDQYVILTQDRDRASQMRCQEFADKLAGFPVGPAENAPELFHYGVVEADGEPLCEVVARALQKAVAALPGFGQDRSEEETRQRMVV